MKHPGDNAPGLPFVMEIFMKKELELYIHIPFCIRKCEYCDFLSGPASFAKWQVYVDALCREIQACRGYEAYEVVSIFFGGGTPSVLPGEWLERVMEQIRERFVVRADAEISIEANPGTVNREKLLHYRMAGINRISFGCQSADDEELKRLGRIHTFEEFLDSFRMARKAGFSNINVDLMFALPGQSRAGWEKSLRKVINLSPEHISAYSLIIEEGTPFAQRKLDLPDEEEERSMYEDTGKILREYGYAQYEISNYAKKGYECRHNCGYWQGREYLGLGLGSASLLEGVRFSNTQDFEQYIDCSADPAQIREHSQQLSRQEQMEEFMFLGMRMMCGVSDKLFYEKFQKTMKEVYGKIITKYVGMGLLEWEGENLRLTRDGIHVSNQIFADFLFD